MLTNNWNSLLQAILRGINDVMMVNTNNTNFTCSQYYDGIFDNCRDSLYKVADTSGIERIGSGVGEQWLLIGSNKGESKPTNYNLYSPILGDNYNVVTQVSSFSPPPSSVFRTITRVVENISNENLIVNEVGYFMRYENSASFMAAREVLPEPVIIEPGERHSFTMAISVS